MLKSETRNLKSEISCCACMGLFAAMLLLVGLPACTSVITPENDPQIVALQEELDKIAKLNSSTRKKVEDLHNHVFALQAKVDGLKENLDELGRRPPDRPPVTASPKRTADAPTCRGEVESPDTEVKLKPRPDRGDPGAKLKKVCVFPKLSPEGEYEKAYEAYAKHRFDEAMALFKKFFQRFPKHDLADNSLYWIGEIHYDTKDYAKAIGAFKEVVTLYAERGKAPDALLKIGYSYVALDDPANARIYFKRVIENYPFSQAEAKARAKLRELENS